MLIAAVAVAVNLSVSKPRESFRAKLAPHIDMNTPMTLLQSYLCHPYAFDSYAPLAWCHGSIKVLTGLMGY